MAVVAVTAWKDRENLRPARLLALFMLLPVLLVEYKALLIQRETELSARNKAHKLLNKRRLNTRTN